MQGFWPESYLLYSKTNGKFRNTEKNLYLSDFERKVKMVKVISKTAVLLDDKIISEHFFPNYIKSIAFVKEGRLIPRNSFEINEIKNILLKNEGLIIKPRYGGGGRDVKVIKCENNIFSLGESRYSSFDDLLKSVLKLDDSIIYPYVLAVGFSNEFYPATLNTIRVLSIANFSGNNIEIVGALQRIGTEKSYPVDNWSSGGISVPINIETGVLGTGIALENMSLKYFDVHPDSNKMIKNTKMPNWEGIKNEVIKMHQNLIFIPYIGWDIVSDGNKILVLEVNSNSDVNLFQIHQPLFKKTGTRSLYKKCKLI